MEVKAYAVALGQLGEMVVRHVCETLVMLFSYQQSV